MTAEVGVLNRNGVALAADSAVTIGRDAYKIYTSADKLFQLNTKAPVGIMIFGNASFCGLPWETLIKEYRKDSAERTFPTLREYVEDFVNFLRNAKSIFNKESQRWQTTELIAGMLTFLREEIRERFDEEIEAGREVEDADIPKVALEVTKSLLKLVRTRPFLEGFDAAVRLRVDREAKAIIKKLRPQLFGTFPIPAALSRAIDLLVSETLVRHFFSEAKSGIVVAGFGDAEYTPSLIAYEFEDMVAGRPRCAQVVDETISRSKRAGVVPFAQQEMVQSFMEGVQGELLTYMQGTTAALFQGAVGSIVQLIEKQSDEAAQVVRDRVLPQLPDLTDALFQKWREKSQDYWQPVVSVVASLPKDELAAMAEALVNLTKFRRRVTNVKETVGGPIDVAVITKGDGFVWIRRKHYFDADLNPRVLAKYHKEAGQ